MVGEKSWLLSPAGVLRSPIRRGGLLHVGYTSASSLSESIIVVTAARKRTRIDLTRLAGGILFWRHCVAVCSPLQPELDGWMEVSAAEDSSIGLDRRVLAARGEVPLEVVLERSAPAATATRARDGAERVDAGGIYDDRARLLEILHGFHEHGDDFAVLRGTAVAIVVLVRLAKDADSRALEPARHEERPVVALRDGRGSRR